MKKGPDYYYLLAFVVFTGFIYGFIFLFLPQSFSLNDDYGHMFNWATRQFDFFSEWYKIFMAYVEQGRFLPIDWFLRLTRYKFFGTHVILYRSVQIFLLSISTFGVYRLLKLVKLTSGQALFGALLFFSSSANKDWIVLTAAAEVIATTFFIWSMVGYFYFTGAKRWFALLLFMCSVLSKESFYVLCAPFAMLMVWDFYKKSPRFRWDVFVGAATFAGAYGYLVTHLPKVYTAAAFKSYPLETIISSTLVPPLKSYGPIPIIVLLLFFLRRKERKIAADQYLVSAAGALTIVTFSAFLVGWIGFNSWGNLQAVIPFGWAMFLAPLFLFEDTRMDRAFVILAGLMCVFTATRGSFNRWMFLNEIKSVAQIACDEYSRNPKLKVFSNCIEGSGQIQNLMKLSGTCPAIPKVEQIENDTLSIEPPYLIMVGDRWCEKKVAPSVQVESEVKFYSWKILKNLNSTVLK